MTGQDPIRTIHVGVGRRGRWPLEVLTADPRFMPSALVDVSPELLAERRHLRDSMSQFRFRIWK